MGAADFQLRRQIIFAPVKGMSTTTSHTRLNWLTVLDYEVEKEHKTLADAVFWAQGTHCTDDRPRRNAESYTLGRTTIIKRDVWNRWQADFNSDGK